MEVSLPGSVQVPSDEVMRSLFIAVYEHYSIDEIKEGVAQAFGDTQDIEDHNPEVHPAIQQSRETVLDLARQADKLDTLPAISCIEN